MSAGCVSAGGDSEPLGAPFPFRVAGDRSHFQGTSTDSLLMMKVMRMKISAGWRLDVTGLFKKVRMRTVNLAASNVTGFNKTSSEAPKLLVFMR